VLQSIQRFMTERQSDCNIDIYSNYKYCYSTFMMASSKRFTSEQAQE